MNGVRGSQKRPEDARPLISLICSTLGERLDSLSRLVISLGELNIHGQAELVVVEQNTHQPSKELVEAAKSDHLQTHYVVMEGRGLARGRNEGLRHATADVVGFPDDDCTMLSGTLERVLCLFKEDASLDIICGMLVDDGGMPTLLRWQRHGGRVDRFNLTRTAIEATTFARRELLLRIGGFDDNLGIGSSGYFGAGEGADLLLRALGAGARIRYDPMVRVCHRTLGIDSDLKRLLYGCGIGEVLRRHSYPRWYITYVASRKLARMAVLACRGRWRHARSEWAWTRGFIAGVRGSVPPCV